jgi:hypothetical protein
MISGPVMAQPSPQLDSVPTETVVSLDDATTVANSGQSDSPLKKAMSESENFVDENMPPSILLSPDSSKEGSIVGLDDNKGSARSSVVFKLDDSSTNKIGSSPLSNVIQSSSDESEEKRP